MPKVFGSVTPPQFGLSVTAAGADSVAPVVLVGEAAARPADVRHLERLQRGDDVVADAAGVGDGRVGADPDAFVDAVAEVFGELAEDIAVDLRAGLRRVDGQRHLILGRNRGRECGHQRNDCET